MGFFTLILLKYVFVQQKIYMLNQYVCFFIISIKIMTISIQFTILACNKYRSLISNTQRSSDDDENLRKIIFKIKFNHSIPLDYNDDIAIIFM